MEDENRIVLLIEDESALLDSYAEILEAEGYKSMKALDGYKGLEALERARGQVSVVLLDLMMPGMDGLEVLRKVKNEPSKYGDMPFIVLTNMTSEKVIKEAFDIGAKSYLIKTELEAEDLVKEIEKVLSE